MIYNLGSINSDWFYTVPHLPDSGETIAAIGLVSDLGGKGANMSIAAARAGARVCHIGAVGKDGAWVVDVLRAVGVKTDHIVSLDSPTGHAIIQRDPRGENTIVTVPGANHELNEQRVMQALANAGAHDTLLFQNETNAQAPCARMASAKGMRVIYASAPYETEALRAVLPFVGVLVLNAVEVQQLQSALGKGPDSLGVAIVIVTRGRDGATLIRAGEPALNFPAPRVATVDTTGAGDTLTGYLAAGLDAGQSVEQALERAIVAASLMTTRRGTASAIPNQKDVDAFSLRIR